MRIGYEDSEQQRGEMDMTRVRPGDLVRFVGSFREPGTQVTDGEIGEVLDAGPESLRVSATGVHNMNGARRTKPLTLEVTPEDVIMLVDTHDPRLSNNRVKADRFESFLEVRALDLVDPSVRHARRKVTASALRETLRNERTTARKDFKAYLKRIALTIRELPQFVRNIVDYYTHDFEDEFGVVPDPEVLVEALTVLEFRQDMLREALADPENSSAETASFQNQLTEIGYAISKLLAVDESTWTELVQGLVPPVTTEHSVRFPPSKYTPRQGPAEDAPAFAGAERAVFKAMDRLQRDAKLPRAVVEEIVGLPIGEYSAETKEALANGKFYPDFARDIKTLIDWQKHSGAKQNMHAPMSKSKPAAEPKSKSAPEPENKYRRQGDSPVVLRFGQLGNEKWFIPRPGDVVHVPKTEQNATVREVLNDGWLLVLEDGDQVNPVAEEVIFAEHPQGPTSRRAPGKGQQVRERVGDRKSDVPTVQGRAIWNAFRKRVEK